jgi:hypothetical protein
VQPANTATVNGDCNDGDGAINPGAQEVCNSGVDDDCDGFADDADPSISVASQGTYYADNDGDGYGTGPVIHACIQPANTATVNGDCNDGNGAVNPGATEVCNSIDDDCDSQIDESGLTASISTSDPTTFCAEGNAILHASPTGAGFSYQWYDENGPIAGATSNGYSATATGDYYVVVLQKHYVPHIKYHQHHRKSNTCCYSNSSRSCTGVQEEFLYCYQQIPAQDFPTSGIRELLNYKCLPTPLIQPELEYKYGIIM